MRTRKPTNVFLSLFMVLSLVLNFSVLSVSAEANKITLSNLPAYSGEAYVELNGNVPNFDKSDMTTKALKSTASLTISVGAEWLMRMSARKLCRPKSVETSE